MPEIDVRDKELFSQMFKCFDGCIVEVRERQASLCIKGWVLVATGLC